jgi:hypothetical protein
MGGSLVIKFVKPTKVFCSWPPYQNSISHVLPSEAKPDVWAGAARILGKSDAAVGKELGGFDSLDCAFNQPPEFLALRVLGPNSPI